MGTTLAELAELVQGTLVGDGQLSLGGANTIRDAKPGEITLADRMRLLPQLIQCQASAAIVSRGMTPESMPYIEVDDVQAAFAAVVTHFRPVRKQRPIGISPAAYLAPSVRLAENVQIHPGVTIGEEVEIGQGTTIHAGVHIMAGCTIGENVTIFPGVVLYEETEIGHRVILHANSVVGAYGFGYDTREGRHYLSAQLGNVVVEDDVEIGAGTTIDRGTYGPTRIGAGTKLDNQVVIAHNCSIGQHNLLCAQAGIAGSSSTGDYVVMAGQSGARDHVHIGNQAMIGAKSGVSSDVPDGEMWIGTPAQAEHLQKRLLFTQYKLPEMRSQLKKLQRLVQRLSKQIDEANPADSTDAAPSTDQQDAA